MRPWRRLLSSRHRSDHERSAVEWLVVGLGNPGHKYEGTRHNVGREVVLEASERLGAPLDQLKHNARFAVAECRGHRVCYATPTLYMNESGRAVAALARFYKVPSERVLVIFDDLDLEVGQLRLRPGGGSGGHKGMSSASRALGTESIPRLRVGIGRPPPRWESTDYVLARFSRDERPVVDETVELAADAVEAVIADGIVIAMNRYN